MPTRPRRRTAAKDLSYVQLEKRLVLVAWLNEQFGFNTNEAALMDAKEAAEGFNADGRSHLSVRLETRNGVHVQPAAMAGYDNNIRDHLRAINTKRATPIVLRYFQYLAMLYAEVYLDWFFGRPGALLDALNRFELRRSTDSRLRDVRGDLPFTRDDLRKLAFWIATGGGKTLLLHINYHQFLRYNAALGEPLDSILLVTPNEGLSEQHLAEMTLSGIPCRRFDLHETGLRVDAGDTVRVIEITKLTEVKKGGGLSVPVEAFEGNNLIFVDEGHKGSGGERWRGYRDALAETGFTFEYSATFGQALTAARNEELTREYAKAIAFDYSYRYFHGDGFGKDFNILNLKEDEDLGLHIVGAPEPETSVESAEERTDRLLLGNLLAFYEQQRVFAEHKDALRPYNLARPLWVFVGGTVNAVYSRNKRKQSDVLTVVRFLQRVLRNSQGWAVAAIGRLLGGESGLERADGRDVFEDRFGYLRDADLTPEALYQDILDSVLHAPTSDVLQLGFVRGSSGEIGVKASGSTRYFGVITIGDATNFRKLVAEREPDIRLVEEAMVERLFDGINAPNTTIEVLIGARKFMEGWNSWRVASMGLMNVGRREGSQIIQLFGRGVRLRGLQHSLKRSSALPGTHPAHIGLLETLNIFAIRADYMAQFKSYLEREDLHAEGVVELSLPVRANKEFLNQGLLVPRVPGDRTFADEAEIGLAPAAGAAVFLDRSLKAQAIESQAGAFANAAAQAGSRRRIPAASLHLVDWNRVHLELLAYREQRGYANLALTPDDIRAVFESTHPPCHELVAEDDLAEPKTLAGVGALSEAVMALAKKYMDRFYRTRQERWASKTMRYSEVRETDANFRDYVVRVPRAVGSTRNAPAEGYAKLLAEITQLIEEGQRIYERETAELPNMHFDRHLYQPLLVQRTAKVTSKPPGLNESEHRFVEDLRDYCRQHVKRQQEQEIFLLRNQSRGSGVGFFEQRGFYPDFILWVKEDGKQRIVFVEPHGMLHAGAYVHDDRARLHETLRELEGEMSRTHSGASEVRLDSYIVSATPFEDLQPKYDDGTWDMERFAARHILFPLRNANYDYLARLLEA